MEAVSHDWDRGWLGNGVLGMGLWESLSFEGGSLD
jgi:hypothetical protein